MSQGKQTVPGFIFYLEEHKHTYCYFMSRNTLYNCSSFFTIDPQGILEILPISDVILKNGCILVCKF